MSLNLSNVRVNYDYNNNTQDKAYKIEESGYKIEEGREIAFDKECVDRYGARTCILFEQSNNIFQVRVLDESNTHEYYIARTMLYETIPKMLSTNYTVVIVENNQGTHEISAVHLPVQASLNTPPILQ